MALRLFIARRGQGKKKKDYGGREGKRERGKRWREQ